MKDKEVNYLEMIARAAEEDKAERDKKAVLPEPAGEQVVNYLAVSQAWKEDPGWMVNSQQD